MNSREAEPDLMETVVSSLMTAEDGFDAAEAAFGGAPSWMLEPAANLHRLPTKELATLVLGISPFESGSKW